MIPLVLTGSIALIFISLPIPAYQQLMVNLFGERWTDVFLYIRDGSFGILSVIMVLSISYSYGVEYNERNGHVTSPIIVSAVSLGSFIAILGINEEGFSISNFGVVGAFIAIVVASTSSLLFYKLISIRQLRINVYTDGANPIYNYALASALPAGITILIFALANRAMDTFLGITDIQQFISTIFTALFARIGSPFWSGVLFIFLVHGFWFFGMHGSNILEPVAQSLFVPALNTNQVLIAAGNLPSEIFTKTFFDTFVLMGGCGSALCLILAILIAGKHKNQRRLTKLSSLFVIFNINELIVFGIPIVLNPVYIVPFIGVPILLTVISFFATYIGLVPYTSHLVEWTTPVFLSGYIATGSVYGSILQLFNLLLGILCYIPFVKLAEMLATTQMKRNLRKVVTIFHQDEERGVVSSLLTRYDEIGNIARFLAADLEHDMLTERISLFYQPQVDYEGNVFGVEALLRWNHKIYGYIYPPLIIALADEAQLIDKLGYWILDTACQDLKRLGIMGLKKISVSVNVSASQLQNDHFIEELDEIIRRHRIEPHQLEIEITEQVALTTSKKIVSQILALKQIGVKLAMDDFGMGHSSLMYLKEYAIDTVKIDGSLVRDILVNSNCQEIISSIVYLSNSLHYSVLAEYVEKDEQRQILHAIGCDRYQGYYFSSAVPFSELLKVVNQVPWKAYLPVMVPQLI